MPVTSKYDSILITHAADYSYLIKKKLVPNWVIHIKKFK